MTLTAEEAWSLPYKGNVYGQVSIPNGSVFIVAEQARKESLSAHASQHRAICCAAQPRRDGEIRTRDPFNPIEVRYLAALRPGTSNYANCCLMFSKNERKFSSSCRFVLR